MRYEVGFLTFAQMRGVGQIGSTMIRAEWLIRHWPGAEQFVLGRKYETVIFQKAYWLEYAQRFKGTKILDVCDPDFLHWKSPCLEMARLCHCVTASTEELAHDIRAYIDKPVVCIPDRVDLSLVSHYRKEHRPGRAKTAAWFGYAENFPALDLAINDLITLGFKELMVISGSKSLYRLPAVAQKSLTLVNHEWDELTFYHYLLQADVVLNYRFNSGRWRYKSNNKSIIAWSVGMPVAHSPQELGELISETARRTESVRRLEEVRTKYDVRASVAAYRALIESVQ